MHRLNAWLAGPVRPLWRISCIGLLAISAGGLGGCRGDDRADRLATAFEASESARRTVLDFGVAEGRAPYASDLPNLEGELTRNLFGSKSSYISVGYDYELMLGFGGGELDGVTVSMIPSAEYRSGWHCRSDQNLPLPEACSQPLAPRELASEPDADAAVQAALPPAIGFSNSNEGAAYLMAGLAQLNGPKLGLVEFYQSTGRMPVVAGDFGFQAYTEALDGQGRVKARFSYPSVGHLRVVYSGAPMDKAELSLIGSPRERPGMLRWDCKVLGVPKSWAPRQCRN